MTSAMPGRCSNTAKIISSAVAKLPQMRVCSLNAIWLRTVNIYTANVFAHDEMSIDNFNIRFKYPVAWFCAKFYLIAAFIGALR